MGFYDNIKAACEKRHYTLTGVLHKIGRSSGVTANWKAGLAPNVNICIEIADFLGITLDELLFGEEHFRTVLMKNNVINNNVLEWLDIISAIPPDRQQLCKEFLKTHMTCVDLGKKTG